MSVKSETAMFCYRDNGTCYAVLSPSEWVTLRKAGRLDAELKRRRDSGAVIEVARPAGFKQAPHFKPREETIIAKAPLNFAERHADTLAALRAGAVGPTEAELDADALNVERLSIQREADQAQTDFETATQMEAEAAPVQWRDGLSYPGNDPENGPARRVPLNGCRECGNDDAERYDHSGLGSCCDGSDTEGADDEIA